MEIIIFLFMNFIVGSSAFIFTYRLFGHLEAVDSLVCWFILFLSQIIFSELILGIFGMLCLKNVIILNLLFLLAVWSISIRKKSAFNKTYLNGLLHDALENKTRIVIVSLLLGFGLVKFFTNLINPPLGWDCLNYHFTFPVEWLKNGNLNNPLVVSDDPFPSYYPINGSLFFLWLILPLKSAFLADLGQFPFFIVSFFSVIAIARKLGLSKEYSFLAAGLFALIPNFFKQLQIGYIDIMVASLFLISLNFILRLKTKFYLKDVILAAVCFGIFIGVKSISLSYGFFILLLFIYFVFSGKDSFLSRKLGYLAVFFFILFLFGGFSYLRNFYLTGNPFYPLEVNFLGSAIFRGVIDKATFTARNEAGGYSLMKLLFHEGMGIQTFLLILPSAIMLPYIAIFKNKSKNMIINYIAVMPLILYLVYRFILPIPNSRYLYPMLGIGMITAFYFLEIIKIPINVVKVISLICAFVSASECSRSKDLIFSFIISIILIVFLSIPIIRKKISHLPSPAQIVFCSMALIIGLNLFFSDYKKNEYERYIKNSRYWSDATLAWSWINANTNGVNIAYVGRPVPYPLYGTDYKNNVYYVSVNQVDPICLHSLHESRYRFDSAETMHKSFLEPINYRGHADYSAWLANLDRRGSDFLFIYSLHHTGEVEFPIEDTWASLHLEKFVLVFTSPTVKIYRIAR